MTKIEILLHPIFSISQCVQAIEKAAAEHSLQITLKATLKQYPGCIHWHFKYGKERGVLEITLWPQKSRAWISIHVNRRADWMEAVIASLSKQEC